MFEQFLFFNPHPRICLLILERRGGGEREEREKHRSPPLHIPTGDRTHNLCMCPDLGSNPKSFGVWDDALTN